MKAIYRHLPRFAAAAVAFAIGVAAASVSAQDTSKDKFKDKMKSMKERSFCSNNNWSDGRRESVSDLRETTIPASGTVNVDGRQNGGVSIKGEDRSDVLVRACVQAWGESLDEAKAKLASIKVNTSGTIKAESDDTDKHWSVSYEIRVPRSTSVNLTAHNGGISITGIDGNAEFETQNGGVFLSDVAGNFKGRTTNGGVFVKLSGNTWKGTGLDVTTTNGGVNIQMPETYAARVETGTVNGGYNTDIAALKVVRDDNDKWGHRATKINRDINGGGPPVRVVTTNGGVRINTSDDKD